MYYIITVLYYIMKLLVLSSIVVELLGPRHIILTMVDIHALYLATVRSGMKMRERENSRQKK